MTDSKKIGAGTVSTNPLVNKKEDFNEDSVEELKVRSKGHDISKAEPESQMVTDAEGRLDSADGKSIKERKEMLKQAGFNENTVFGKPEKGRPAKPASGAPLKSEPVLNVPDDAERPAPKQVALSRELLHEMKTKNIVTENTTVRGLVMQDADGAPIKDHPDLDGLAAQVDEVLQEPQQKPQAEKIGSLGRMLSLFRSIRRLIVSRIVHTEGDLKAKHFHSIPEKVLDALQEGSTLKRYVEDYNAVQRELKLSKQQSLDSAVDPQQLSKQRAELKQKLFIIYRQIQVELYREAHEAAKELSKECHGISDPKQFKTIAEILTNTVNFDPRKVKINSPDHSDYKISFEGWFNSVGRQLTLPPPKPLRLHELAHSAEDSWPPVANLIADDDDELPLPPPPAPSGMSEEEYAASPLADFPAPPPVTDKDIDSELPLPPPPEPFSEDELNEVKRLNQSYVDLPPPPELDERAVVEQVTKDGYPPIAPKPSQKDN